MKKIYRWFMLLSKRVRDSIKISFAAIGGLSTIFTIIGVSLDDCRISNVWIRLCIVFVVAIIFYFVAYNIIGIVFKDTVNLVIRKTPISITCGDIFNEDGLKVIGCDSHFDTRVDDKVIIKKSLHGQLVLNHGKKEEIQKAIENEAKRLNLRVDENGRYEFPLGTIIRYDSSIDNQTYLMLAMTKLDENYEAHTNMAEYEQTLMRMWKEIDRVYAMNDISVPILGDGIPRFDNGPIGRDALLKCMLCTLNSSGVSFKASLKVVIYGNITDIPLYEYKDMFREVLRR